jgi:hypothetical protein
MRPEGLGKHPILYINKESIVAFTGKAAVMLDSCSGMVEQA